jgi:hypothetical protein
MIYTIGRKDIYEPYLATLFPRKGKGGSVWKSFRQAKKYCIIGFKVYGVDADWKTDTCFSKYKDSFRCLKRNARLIRL